MDKSIVPENVYIILLAFVIFFVFSFSRFLLSKSNTHKKKRKIAKFVKNRVNELESDGQILGYFKKIDCYAFEELLLDSFEDRGFKVIRNKRYSNDGGVDGRVIIRGHTFLIQAKRYKGYISPSDVRFLNDICMEQDTYGIFVHTGKTGPSSKSDNFDRIIVISGDMLVRFIKTKDEITLKLNKSHFIKF